MNFSRLNLSIPSIIRRLLILLSVLSVFDTSSFSQSSSITGTIADSLEKKNVAHSVISLMGRRDSVLLYFTRADADGRFSFNKLPEGSYIFMITHPFFGDYFDTVSIHGNVNIDLGKLFMTPKSKLLAEVILRSGTPIRIKGDTTIYTADSFKVREGANVEELLRRLPGIQVDRNGQITAMGQVVRKVLVDGEEFFGSDPGIATKNLRADIVKEVQVFDKKSDAATFTGIDDGIKTKTINLKIKEEKKNGYFGKVEAGGGLQDKYNNDIMMNAFKGKRKMAAYGIMSNTGQTNLNYNDAANYGDEESVEGSMIMLGGDADDYSGGKNGIPRNRNAGLHYSNEFDKDRESINTGYRYSRVDAPGNILTFSKTFLPDTSWSTNTRNNSFNSVVKHSLSATFESTLDSMNEAGIKVKGDQNDTRNSSAFFSESFTDAGDSINTSDRTRTAVSSNKNLSVDMFWRHKFKKTSRTLSILSGLNSYKAVTDGFLFSRNRYFLGGLFNHTDTIDQQNTGASEGGSIDTKFRYTDQLRKDFYMELSYSFIYNSNSNERVILVPGAGSNGKYTEVVDSLSNSFAFNHVENKPGILFRVIKKDYTIAIGSTVDFSHYLEKNISTAKNIRYNYTNYFPRAGFSHKLNAGQLVLLDYSGATIAPSLEQLQPTIINTDPLNLYIGNPNLRQSFRHSINGSYTAFNMLKQSNIYVTARFELNQNAFSQSNAIDSLGRRVYQTVNVNGVYSLTLSGVYQFKINGNSMIVNFSPVAMLSRNVDFVNGVKDFVRNNTYSFSFNLDKYVKDKFQFSFGPKFGWTHSRASVNSSSNTDFWQLDAIAGGSIFFPHGLDLNTDLYLQIRQKDPRFPSNNNYTTWNAKLIKRFFKDKFETTFGVFDILNQNKGYQRDFNSYSYTESYFTTLKRFWTLTLTWNIVNNRKLNSLPAQ